MKTEDAVNYYIRNEGRWRITPYPYDVTPEFAAAVLELGELPDGRRVNRTMAYALRAVIAGRANVRMKAPWVRKPNFTVVALDLSSGRSSTETLFAKNAQAAAKVFTEAHRECTVVAVFAGAHRRMYPEIDVCVEVLTSRSDDPAQKQEGLAM